MCKIRRISFLLASFAHSSTPVYHFLLLLLLCDGSLAEKREQTGKASFGWLSHVYAFYATRSFVCVLVACKKRCSSNLTDSRIRQKELDAEKAASWVYEFITRRTLGSRAAMDHGTGAATGIGMHAFRNSTFFFFQIVY